MLHESNDMRELASIVGESDWQHQIPYYQPIWIIYPWLVTSKKTHKHAMQTQCCFIFD